MSLLRNVIGPHPNLWDYVNNIRNPTVKSTIKKRVQEYQPKPQIIEKFSGLTDRYFFVVFATEWNVECRAELPNLMKFFAATNNAALNVKVIDFDENRDIADEMNVLRIPTIIVHDKSWREIGRFVEKPQHGETLEDDLWWIIQKHVQKTN
ncbi:MAG TPA: thioredoxin family protein [Candidatus Bathyarchaeia archaeon]|nr:thioredoxin family protein [Candidatus Bathyarchaeia archaeon]